MCKLAKLSSFAQNLKIVWKICLNQSNQYNCMLKKSTTKLTTLYTVQLSFLLQIFWYISFGTYLLAQILWHISCGTDLVVQILWHIFFGTDLVVQISFPHLIQPKCLFKGPCCSGHLVGRSYWNQIKFPHDPLFSDFAFERWFWLQDLDKMSKELWAARCCPFVPIPAASLTMFLAATPPTWILMRQQNQAGIFHNLHSNPFLPHSKNCICLFVIYGAVCSNCKLFRK